MTDYKKQDMDAIIAFMTGKEAVEVTDIIAYSGANKMRVYPILAELLEKGKLVMLATENLGSPKTVKLV